ncbi:cupin domain-containing protein [Rhodanobacter lindaniclasticus]|uniref:Cupin n=1 Tax=Rhodanobacter lindaniclasticus TaxID=75310 RepID=A0A4S3KBQ2_9GAMM|nr:cupin domain-containing protein [Rhodanobacter lindaniclasticus]THD05759.1 cupin [Rhodanobacter lindaniclasticus]
MSVTDLPGVAAQLERAWCSTRVAGIGGANLKLTRMDAQAYPSETHDYAEGLLVLEGELHLELAGAPLVVRAGELCVVPAGVPHAVSAGSRGTLLIVDS